ncbi:MAG: DUF2182 domain-containing protein [Pseudomonadota bacterium]
MATPDITAGAASATDTRRLVTWGLFFAGILVAWVLLAIMSAAVEDGPGSGSLTGYIADLCLTAAGELRFSGLLAMWALMALAMMAPTAVPFFRTFDDFRHARPEAVTPVHLAVLMVGFGLVWLTFAVFAAAGQMLLWRASLVDLSGQSTSLVLTGALLAAAGLYQWTPLKEACLTACRAPLAFFLQHWRPGTDGALAMGARHGLDCLGCCIALMALAFVGGAMNIYWMALATLLMALEKLPAIGRPITTPLGIALLAAAFLTFGRASGLL